MIRRSMAFGALVAIALANFPALAEVTAVTFDGFMKSGKGGNVWMMVASPDSVDGLNGEMSFDTNLFSNPAVFADVGSPGFTALGNEVSPGLFRFILYKNPANQNLSQADPVLRFSLFAKPGLLSSTSSQVTFTMAASARVVVGDGGATSAVSVQPTTFEPFTIFIGGASAKNWELYE
jgi:hypothetical protein